MPKAVKRRSTRLTGVSTNLAWDKVNDECQTLGKVRPFSCLRNVKKRPKGPCLVENEERNHVVVWNRISKEGLGYLYNPNDCKDGPLGYLGFDKVKDADLVLADRKEPLNFGHHGTCRLICMCILGCLKEKGERDPNDLMTMSGQAFVKKYARGRIAKKIKSLGL